MMNPLAYPLCQQQVTVYRLKGDTVMRQVLQGCFYRYEDTWAEAGYGKRFVRKFLLIQPGDTQLVFPGDRIYPGEGPELTVENYQDFLPSVVPGLSQVAYAAPWYWDGKICHTEAGRK